MTNSSETSTSELRPHFWQHYALTELSTAEWEALCDGCGVCCLVKFVDDDMLPEEVEYTDVGCKLLDCQTGWCASYPNRHQYVPDCISLKAHMLANMMWLPETCAYKRLHLGQDLPQWHFLLTNDRKRTQTGMRQAGVGVAGRCISEVDIDEEDIEERIVHWVEV